MDALTYAGNLENLDDVMGHERLRFIKGDIRDVQDVTDALDGVDVIVNAAAESHVSKSIEQGGAEFVTTNVVGTQVLLDAIRERPVERFILISSSEVYGTAESDPMTEEHPLNPRSPYAGTKAGGDRLAYSYWCTYDLPVTVIRPFNNYGPYQHPEKVIPRFIIQALTDRPLTIHGGGQASRDWLHVFDTAEAITPGLRGAAGADRRRDDQRRHRRRRVGRADRRHDPGAAGQAGVAEGARRRPARARSTATSAPPTGPSGCSAGRPASRSRTASSARSPGTGSIRSGGRRFWRPSRRPRPSDADRPRAGRRHSGRRSRRRPVWACARSSATLAPGVGDVPVSSEDTAGVARVAREQRRRRPDRARHRLAGADRRLRGRGSRPGASAGRAPRRCWRPTRSPSARCSSAAGVGQPAWSAQAPPGYPGGGEGARPPGAAGDDDRRAAPSDAGASGGGRSRRLAQRPGAVRGVRAGPGGDGERVLGGRPLPAGGRDRPRALRRRARRRPAPRLPERPRRRGRGGGRRPPRWRRSASPRAPATCS